MSGYFSATVCLLLVMQPGPLLADKLDNRGKEFIIGFMENKLWLNSASKDPELVIAAATNNVTNATVTLPLFDPGFTKSVSISPGTAVTVTVPRAIRGENVEKSNKSILVTSDHDISVFGVNMETYSTDAYIALPVEVLGVEYYTVTYVNKPELMVVGTADNTQVSITFPNNTFIKVKYGGLTYTGGSTLTVNLDRYETFHVLNNAEQTTKQESDDRADFTGAHIVSNNPVAVLSGNMKAQVPAESVKLLSADHIVEMMMPVDTLGTHFLTTNTPDRKIGDLYRFVATEDNTTISFHDGFTEYISNKGRFVERDMKYNYQSVTSNKPVLVAMIAKSFNDGGQRRGDPAISLIIPVLQYDADYTWSTVRQPDGTEFINAVTVIIDREKKDDLLLDGIEPIVWKGEANISGSNKVNLWRRIKPGSHTIRHKNPNATFFVLASGVAKHHSYAYLAGLKLDHINANCTRTPTVPGDKIDNDCDGKVDEEIANGKDDDGDKEIDEDLEKITPPPPPPRNRTHHYCEIYGDPHLHFFGNHCASIAIPCTYLVTNLRLLNRIRNRKPRFNEIRVEVVAGNNETTERGRYFVSDVRVKVSFYRGPVPVAWNTFETGEQLILEDTPWLYDAHSLVNSRVNLTYDENTRLAELRINFNSLRIRYRPINRDQGLHQTEKPGVFVEVENYDLIYDDSILFPNTMCSTVNDTTPLVDHAAKYNVSNPHNIGIFALVLQNQENALSSRSQSKQCGNMTAIYKRCPTQPLAFNTCIVLPRHAPIVRCVDDHIPDTMTMDAAVDCLRYRCEGDTAACNNLLSYNETCPTLASTVDITHC